MRTSWVLGGLLASLATAASAGSNYSDCITSPDPAACIARRAVDAGLDPEYSLQSVVRHGLVDLVPARSRELMRGLYVEIGKPGAKMSAEEKELDSTTAATMRKTPRKTLLAAIALVTAARHETDPFANPVYLKLAHDAKDDPRIPALALGLWSEIMGFGGGRPSEKVTHAGLPAIWVRAEIRREQDTALLEDIAGRLAYFKTLLPQVREFYLWLVQRPDLSPDVRVGAASSLARYFDMPEQADQLLEGIKQDSGGYGISGVRASVAAARLEKGYDAGSARLVKDEILDDFKERGVVFYLFTDTRRDALEIGKAREELREIAVECLRRAEATVGIRSGGMDWYAEASDFYLRAGDVERAREIARQALPLVSVFLRDYMTPRPGGDSTYLGDLDDPKAMAQTLDGIGTSPVIALYRTGAIQEALQTGLLVGKHRYLNADRAGEKKDPRWATEHYNSVDSDIMVDDAAHSADRDFQERAYYALVRSCRTVQLADCFEDTLLQIAEVAAGMGDEARMNEALTAVARKLDTMKYDAAWRAINFAGPWAHAEELLGSAKQAVRSANR